MHLLKLFRFARFLLPTVTAFAASSSVAQNVSLEQSERAIAAVTANSDISRTGNIIRVISWVPLLPWRLVKGIVPKFQPSGDSTQVMAVVLAEGKYQFVAGPNFSTFMVDVTIKLMFIAGTFYCAYQVTVFCMKVAKHLGDYLDVLAAKENKRKAVDEYLFKQQVNQLKGIGNGRHLDRGDRSKFEEMDSIGFSSDRHY